MSGRCLFDQIFRCDRRFVAVILLATMAVASCAPDSNRMAMALQSASGWMNNVPPSPPVPEWRLSKRPGLNEAPFPKLSDVPARPTDLPSAADFAAMVTALTQDNAAAGKPDAKRPRGTISASQPPPARMEPLTIPGVGVIRN
jgi:hypothetical protein